ncbi:MAG: thiamine diphosphokinase [Ruminococcus sp.]|jgi:thiamine pyrophosphokinase|nr:thiamine diphosphokinase [Ruminococcus sp.]
MKQKCIIVGGGDFFYDETPFNEKKDFIIACDSGLNYLIEKKIVPDLIIGDFDSLGYVPDNAVVLPAEKDVTDIKAAVDYALEKGFTDFEIYGGLGGERLSHTIANIQNLIFLINFFAEKNLDTEAKKSCNCTLYGDKIAITAMGKGEKYYENFAFKNKYISVFAYTESAVVSLSGLKYELKEFTLSNSVPLGVSNEFDFVNSKSAKITVHSGIVLIVFEF